MRHVKEEDFYSGGVERLQQAAQRSEKSLEKFKDTSDRARSNVMELEMSFLTEEGVGLDDLRSLQINHSMILCLHLFLSPCSTAL